MADNKRWNTGDNKAGDPSAHHGNGTDVAAATGEFAASDATLPLHRISDPLHYADELEDTGEFLALKLPEEDANEAPPAEAGAIASATPTDVADATASDAPVAPTERATYWLSHLEGEIQRLQGKWEVVEGELKLREARIEELRAEATERDSAIEALRRAAEENAASNESLQSELLRATDRVNELIAGHASRALELSQRSTELAAANAAIEALRDQLAVSEASMAQLTHTIEQGRIATADAERRLEAQISAGNELRGTIQELETYIDGRKQSWSTLNAKMAEYQDGIATLERGFAQKETELAQHAKSEAALEAKIADLERSAVESAERRKQRDAAYEELEAKLAEQAATATQLRSELASAEKQAEGKRAALETERTELNARILEFTTSLRERDDRISSLQIQTSTMEQSKRDTEQRAAAHELELAEAKSRVDILQRDLAARGEVVVRLEAALRERQQALDLLERNVRRLDQLGASLAGLDDKVSQVGAEIVAANITAVNGHGKANGNGKVNGNGKANGRAVPAQAGRRLIAIDGDTRTSYALFNGETTIGRAAESDIRIPSPFISRLHARIRMEDTATVIEDLGSKNGVLVNSTPVERQAPLHDGDVISLGGSLELQYVDPDRPRPPAGATNGAS